MRSCMVYHVQLSCARSTVVFANKLGTSIGFVQARGKISLRPSAKSALQKIGEHLGMKQQTEVPSTLMETSFILMPLKAILEGPS